MTADDTSSTSSPTDADIGVEGEDGDGDAAGNAGDQLPDCSSNRRSSSTGGGGNDHSCSVTGYCILHSWVCDGYEDCLLGDDERNCDPESGASASASPVSSVHHFPSEDPFPQRNPRYSSLNAAHPKQPMMVPLCH